MIRRILGVLGLSVLAGGFAAAIPIFVSILTAAFGTLVIVGLYALRAMRRRRRTA